MPTGCRQHRRCIDGYPHDSYISALLFIRRTSTRRRGYIRHLARDFIQVAYRLERVLGMGESRNPERFGPV